MFWEMVVDRGHKRKSRGKERPAGGFGGTRVEEEGGGGGVFGGGGREEEKDLKTQQYTTPNTPAMYTKIGFIRTKSKHVLMNSCPRDNAVHTKAAQALNTIIEPE